MRKFVMNQRDNVELGPKDRRKSNIKHVTYEIRQDTLTVNDSLLKRITSTFQRYKNDSTDPVNDDKKITSMRARSAHVRPQQSPTQCSISTASSRPVPKGQPAVSTSASRPTL